MPIALQEHAIITELDVENSRVSYTTNLEGGSFLNDLDATLREIELGSILGSTFFLDQDKETCSTSNAFFIKIIEVIKTSRNKATDRGDQGNIEPSYIPKIRFSTTNDLVPINSYQDKDFFTATYLTLFPYRIGGYLKDESSRSKKLSLEAFTKQALSYHSYQ